MKVSKRVSRRRLAAAPLIRLEHCSLTLNEQPILQDINFELRSGERWALVGPNGSGKTFLLKMLRGDVWPTPTGVEKRTYRVTGRAMSEPAGSKELIAYIGPERQDKYRRYDWDLTVTQIVTTGLFDEDVPLTTPTAAQRARVQRVMQRFGLTSLRNRRMLSLSYGQQRLVLVARAFASQARVLLLDEVFNGLDAKVRERLCRALERKRQDARQAWVLTTHRGHELPGSITHVARLSRGRLVEQGPIEDASVHPGGEEAPALRIQSGHEPDAEAAPFIQLQQVNVFRDYRPVLRDVNWTLHRGEHWAILGRNGSGKSTLLNLLYGDLHPALGGTVERADFRQGSHIAEWKRRVGWVSPELQAEQFSVSTIEEVVLSGRYSSIGLNDPATTADKRAAKRWMNYFGLEPFAQRRPRELSYGQMRLALIARAMLNDPELLLLDEPCTGLDPNIRQYILEFIEALAQGGTQVVMAVHDAEDIIPSITHVLQIRRGGRVVPHTRRAET